MRRVLSFLPLLLVLLSTGMRVIESGHHHGPDPACPECALSQVRTQRPSEGKRGEILRLLLAAPEVVAALRSACNRGFIPRPTATASRIPKDPEATRLGVACSLASRAPPAS